MKVKNICCLGAGYVGGPTMAVIANKNPKIKVTVADLDKKKIKKWNDKNLENLPIYEPGLANIISKTRNINLFFSDNIKKSIKEADIIFIAVNTPTKTFGKGKNEASNLEYVESCARSIANYAEGKKIIVEKSTIPVKTANLINDILTQTSNNLDFEILSNPEFLAEGTAINDLLYADRILIGGNNTINGKKAKKTLSKIYNSWIPINKILLTNVWSSELSKLVANAFLAQRVSSINSVAELCEKTDANISEVSNAIGLDSRIGSSFLNASVGFGGSCFQKDILNLIYISKSFGLNEVADYWEQVIKMNNYQRKRFVDIILSNLFNTISNKKLALLGWSFKKDTNDSRESSSIFISKMLIEEKSILHIYDPKVNESQIKNDLVNIANIKKSDLKNQIKVFNDPIEAINKSHAIAVLTEWDEFKVLDWKYIYKLMEKPSFIFDGRRILDKSKLSEIGFKVFTIGE